jgi:hypothetical protein
MDNASLEVETAPGMLPSKRIAVGNAALVQDLGATPGVLQEQADILRKKGQLNFDHA